MRAETTMLLAFMKARVNRLKRLKENQLVAPDSELAFNMFIDGSVPVEMNVFFLDKEFTKLVFVNTEVEPHPRIQPGQGVDPSVDGKLITPAAMKRTKSEYTDHGLTQVPRNSTSFVDLKSIPRSLWDVFGDEDLDTMFLDKEKRVTSSGSTERHGVSRILQERAMAQMQSPVPIRGTKPDNQVSPTGVMGFPGSPFDSPCDSPIESPAAQACQLDPIEQWRLLENANQRAPAAAKLKLDAAALATVVKASTTQDTAAKALAKTVLQEAKDLASQLKEHTAHVISQKTKFKQQQSDDKNAAKALKDGMLAAVRKEATKKTFTDVEGFVSETFFPYAQHTEKDWMQSKQSKRTIDTYLVVRESRKRSVDDSDIVERMNDRVMKSPMHLTVINHKALVEEDETHFAFLKGKFAYKSRQRHAVRGDAF
jgi:hypothetical protein